MYSDESNGFLAILRRNDCVLFVCECVLDQLAVNRRVVRNNNLEFFRDSFHFASLASTRKSTAFSLESSPSASRARSRDQLVACLQSRIRLCRIRESTPHAPECAVAGAFLADAR